MILKKNNVLGEHRSKSLEAKRHVAQSADFAASVEVYEFERGNFHTVRAEM